MRWFAWLILVSLATVGAYYVTYVMREPADAGHEDLPQPIINLLALAHDQPVAVFAAIAVMSVLMLLTIASLAIRLGGLRRTLWRERTDRDIALRRELWREREGIDTPEDAEPTSTD